MFAREEGRRMGYKEGLSIGRRIGYDEGRGSRLIGPSDRLPYRPLPLEHHDDDENVLEIGGVTADEERNDPRSNAQLHSSASVRQQPYVIDCVARSSSPTLIAECVPNRRHLYIRWKRPHLHPRFRFHRTLSLPASPRLLLSIMRLLPLVDLMGQKRFARYPSAPALPWQPSASLLTTDGSQGLILIHPSSTCHPRTSCSNPSPRHQVPSRPNSRRIERLLDRSPPQSHHPSHATTAITRPLRHLFPADIRHRSHPGLLPISPNMI